MTYDFESRRCLIGSVRYALLGPLAGVSGGACPAEVSSLRLLSFDMGGFKNRNEEYKKTPKINAVAASKAIMDSFARTNWFV